MNTIYYTILYFTSSNDDGTVYSREMRGIQEEVNQAKSSYCVPPAVLLLSLIHYSSSLRRTILHYKLRVEGSLTESNQKTFMRLRERKRKEKGKQASKQECICCQTFVRAPSTAFGSWLPDHVRTRLEWETCRLSHGRRRTLSRHTNTWDGGMPSLMVVRPLSLPDTVLREVARASTEEGI